MNRIEDFEWREEGFDVFYFAHKTREMTIARISHFSGWQVSVYKANKSGEHIATGINELEAAKAIAMVHINIHFKEYDDASRYSPRASNRRPGRVPEGVFKMV
jgi:hypothetical protein